MPFDAIAVYTTLIYTTTTKSFVSRSHKVQSSYWPIAPSPHLIWRNYYRDRARISLTTTMFIIRLSWILPLACFSFSMNSIIIHWDWAQSSVTHRALLCSTDTKEYIPFDRAYWLITSYCLLKTHSNRTIPPKDPSYSLYVWTAMCNMQHVG